MEDDQQFCLRWNNHQSTLIQNFDTLLESGTLVDCTLAAEGKYLKAHKVVLSACSPYFEGLLSEHYDKHPVFILKDVKFKELKAMMDYMYRGEVNISQDQLAALLKAAESLQIKGLSESRTSGSSKTDFRQQKVVPQTTSQMDIPQSSSGLTIEKNKVPRQGMAQGSVGDLPEDSASPQIPKGLSSREGSQSPTSRKRKKFRRKSIGDDNSIENHEASNSSDMPQQMSVPALGIAPVADEKVHADPTDSIGRSALMTQLTKPADEMLQLPLEKPEPNDNLIEPKSEYLEDQEESVEDLTLDDDMNDLNEMEQDNNRAGPSHDPSQHPAGIGAWHVTGDRSNAGGVVGSVAGAPGTTDEVFLAAQEAAQAHRDSQGNVTSRKKRRRIKVATFQRILRALNEEISIRPIARMTRKVNNHEKKTSPIDSFDRKKRENSMEGRIDGNDESSGNSIDDGASNKESVESFSSEKGNDREEGGAKEGGRSKDPKHETSNDTISVKCTDSEQEMDVSCVRLDSSPSPKLKKLNKKLRVHQGRGKGKGRKLAVAVEERSERGEGSCEEGKDSRGQSESSCKLVGENSAERVEKGRRRGGNRGRGASSARRVGQRGGNSRERVFNKRGESCGKRSKEDKRMSEEEEVEEEGGNSLEKRNEEGEKREVAGPSRMRRDSVSSTASTVTEWMDTVDLNKYRTTYACKLCEKTFLRATNLSSHMKRNCLKNPEAKCNKRSVNTNSHVCKMCGHCFKERKSLTHHIRNECGRISMCEYCNKIFKAAKVPYRHYGICKNRHTRKNNATPVSYVRRFGQRSNDESDCSISECSSPSLNVTDEMASDTE